MTGVAMFTCGQRRDVDLRYAPLGVDHLRYPMFITYRRVGRISALPALVTVAAAMMVAGVAAITLVIIGVAGCGVSLLRACGRSGRADRRVPAQDHQTIEGVIVDSTDVSDQLLRLDSDKG